MRGLHLYARSRRVPLAVGTAAGIAALLWVLWGVGSDSPEVGLPMVVSCVVLLVAALTMTLSGPDDELDQTGAVPWRARRALHLVAVLVLVAGLLVVTQVTGVRFGPVALVLRDAAGLVGLTALCAAVLGTARAWFAPLGWTVAAILFPQADTVPGSILTWQSQDPSSAAAALTATTLALTGLVAYTVRGPARSASAGVPAP